MKRAGSKLVSGPSAASLSAMPEVDFSGARRNPYARRIRREGYEVVHDEPSRASVEEMPEGDFSAGTRNPYAQRVAAQGIRPRTGRPRRGEASEPTRPHSVRLSESVWDALKEAAERRGVTVHAAVRLAIATLLEEESDGAKSDTSTRVTGASSSGRRAPPASQAKRRATG